MDKNKNLGQSQVVSINGRLYRETELSKPFKALVQNQNTMSFLWKVTFKTRLRVLCWNFLKGWSMHYTTWRIWPRNSYNQWSSRLSSIQSLLRIDIFVRWRFYEVHLSKTTPYKILYLKFKPYDMNHMLWSIWYRRKADLKIRFI